MLQYRTCSRELLAECIGWCKEQDNHTLRVSSVLTDALISGKLAKAFLEKAKHFVASTRLTQGAINAQKEVQTHVDEMRARPLCICDSSSPPGGHELSDYISTQVEPLEGKLETANTKWLDVNTQAKASGN